MTALDGMSCSGPCSRCGSSGASWCGQQCRYLDLTPLATFAGVVTGRQEPQNFGSDDKPAVWAGTQPWSAPKGRKSVTAVITAFAVPFERSGPRSRCREPEGRLPDA